MLFQLDDSLENELNLRVDGVGPDIINVSWNGKEYWKHGVHEVSLVAKSQFESTPIAVATVNTSISKLSITDNIKPSTAYRIYIKEISRSKLKREVHYIATADGGEFLRLKRIYLSHK